MKKVMMTVFKIVLILIAVVVVGVVALILFALHKESNYYKYTEAVGEIEQKYTAFGDKEVSCQEFGNHPHHAPAHRQGPERGQRYPRYSGLC